MKFYLCPKSNLFTHCFLFFSREVTSETYGPGSLSHIFAFAIYFFLAFIFRSIKPKIQKYLVAIYFICDLLFQSIRTFSRHHVISGAVPRKGLTTPLTRRVARCCYLCAGAVYVVLLGSPTDSITLFISEGNTYYHCAASSLPLWGNTDCSYFTPSVCHCGNPLEI